MKGCIVKFLFLGRKPVLDSFGDVVSYHIGFNGDSLKQKLAQVNYTTCISQLMHTFQLENSLEGKKAWIKIDSQSLLHTDLTLLSKDMFIFYLMKAHVLSDALFEKIEDLLAFGYEFVVESTLANEIMRKKGISYLSKFTSVMFDGRDGKSFRNIVAVLESNDAKCSIRNVKTTGI